MMPDRDTDRILRTWFHDGVAPLPDRVLDSVLGGLPHVRQRRRLPFPKVAFARPGWPRALAVAVVLLALVTGLVFVAGSHLLAPPPPRPMPEGEDVPLDPGRYVQQAMPVRFAVTMPVGWRVAELTNDFMALTRDEPGGSELVVMFVEALYVDPCRPELGINEALGSSSADLATALAALPGVQASAISTTTIDGRAGASVTLTAGTPFAGCSGVELDFPIVALPQPYGLAEGTAHRFWTVELDGRRLLLAARLGSPAGEPELRAIVASIDLDAPSVPEPTDPLLPTLQLLPTMPSSGIVPPGVYALEVSLYGVYEDGVPEGLSGPHDAAFEVMPGWFATSRGVAAEAESPASATLAVWTVSTVYVDPCRWQTSERRDAGALRDVAGVTSGLSAWWPPTPDPALTAVGYAPPEHAPNASDPLAFVWLGSSREVVLDVPSDFDVATCDEGEYRIWEDPAGAARTAQPGEHIKLWIGDVAPAVVVVEAARLVSATALDAQAVDAMLHTMWVGRRPAR